MGRRLHGKHGMYILNPRVSSKSIISTHLHLKYDDQKALGKFVVIMYDRSSAAAGTDEARQDMFVGKQKSFDASLAARTALIQHITCAAYQGGYIRCQAVTGQVETEGPDMGMKCQNDTWQTFWTTLPPVAQLSTSDKVWLKD